MSDRTHTRVQAKNHDVSDYMYVRLDCSVLSGIVSTCHISVDQ